MLRNMRAVYDKIEGIVASLEKQEIEGPIPFLEEANDIIQQAIEEYQHYQSELNSDED